MKNTTKLPLFTPKKGAIFTCKKCDFVCYNKKDYNRHIDTNKHKKNGYNHDTTKITQNALYVCECGKQYSYRASLFNHKKKCDYNEKINENDNNIQINIKEIEEKKEPEDNKLLSMNEIFMQMMKKNNELQDLLMEQSKQTQEYQYQMKELIQNNNTIANVTQNNTQNNHFNLNFFLNEQCKNAMDISDFLKTIQVEINDVANVGKLGYVEGISRIFMKALKNLDIYERPIHCSDLKREVLYVKDNGIWEKEGEDKNSLKKAVQIISHRNVMKIKAWTDANPTWKTHYSKEEDEYLKISYESMGGATAEEDNKYFNKIIRKIASNVTIDKDKM